MKYFYVYIEITYLEWGLGQRDGQGDGLVELAAAWFDGDDGRDGDAVAEGLGDEVVGDGHRLE